MDIKSCIESLQKCIIVNKNCIAECFNKKNSLFLEEYINLNMECAAVCEATVSVLSFGGRSSIELIKICIELCNSCATECEKNLVSGCCEKYSDAFYQGVDACLLLLQDPQLIILY